MYRRSKEFAAFGFLPPRASTTNTAAETRDNNLVLLFLAHCHDDRLVEDLLDADAFFCAALHVYSAHLGCDSTALLGCNRCQALGLEKVDAGLFVAEVRL